MEVRVARTSLRLVAGLLDLVPVGGLAAGALAAWYRHAPADLPPRYWNLLDYAVDLVHQRPEAVAAIPVAFAAAYVLWETAWTRAIGAAPVARLLGIRVVSTSGAPVGILRSFVRAAASLVLAAAFGIGPAWALLSPRRRMLHDILCGCLAVRGPQALPEAGGAGPEDAGDPEA